MAGVLITITGKNGVSQTFSAIERDATELATSLENTGRRGATAMTQAGESAQTMGQEIVQASEQSAVAAEHSAEAAESSFSKWSGAAQKVGIALGALTLEAGKSAGELQAAQAQMATSFQDAGLSIEDYSGQIEAAVSKGEELAFNQKGIDTSLASLIGVTKDAGKAFTDLQLAEDIARGTGESLSAATTTVMQVEAGRYRGLAALGIALDSTASKNDYLAAAQQRFAGQSEAFATTGAAQWDRWKNTAEAALEGVGSHLTGIQGPLLAISASTTILGEMGKVLGEIGPELKESAAAGLLLDSALGPVGLAAGALAAGAGILYLITRTREFTTAASVASGEAQNLNNFFLSLEASLDPVRAQSIKVFNDNLNEFAADAAKRNDDLARYTDLEGRFETAAASGGQMQLTISDLADGFGQLSQAELAYIDTNQDGILTIDEASAAVTRYQDNLDRLNVDQVKAQQSDITKIFSQSTVDYQKAIDGITQWEAELKAGTITGDQYIALLDNAAANQSVFARATGDAAVAIAANTAAVQANASAYQATIPIIGAVIDAAKRWGDMAEASQQSQSLGLAADAMTHLGEASRAMALPTGMVTEVVARQTQVITQSTAATILHQSALSGDAAALAAIGQSQASVAVPASQLTEAVKQQSLSLKDDEAAAQAAAKAIDAYRSALGEVHMVVNDGANQFAKHATVAGNALDAGQRVVIGNTDAVAQSSQAVADWGAKLINVKGQIGEIDTLLAKGVITQGEYNKAQSAETSIFHTNAAIQRDILKIQTDQAPLMAQLDNNTQKYMDHLASLPAAQQLVRLGFMDSAESAKALSINQLMVAASTGEMGKAGKETATTMIQAAAEGDPVLEKMLESIHAITVDPKTGEIKVNWDDVKGATSDTDKLTGAVRHLTEEIDKVLEVIVNADSVTGADSDVGNLASNLETLDGKHATVYADLNDAASASLKFISDTLDGLNGKSAFVTVYQNTVGSVQSVANQLNGSGAYNGGVVGYANGGAVRAMLAEIDPEIVHLAGGGVALARSKGVYDVPRGSYVSTAPATRSLMAMGGPTIQVIVQGNVYGMDDLTEQVTRELTPALVAAFESHYAGYGV